jgi:pimeloyl-ACP methyl ester carboxylesterase
MELSNSSDVAIGQNFANSEIQASQCLAATEDIGGLIGTAFVARDMARIVDALEEDGLLRYWGKHIQKKNLLPVHCLTPPGFSYGTLLGATFAAMFPEKVGSMVIDGNVNVHEYYSGRYVSRNLDRKPS